MPGVSIDRVCGCSGSSGAEVKGQHLFWSRRKFLFKLVSATAEHNPAALGVRWRFSGCPSQLHTRQVRLRSWRYVIFFSIAVTLRQHQAQLRRGHQIRRGSAQENVPCNSISTTLLHHQSFTPHHLSEEIQIIPKDRPAGQRPTRGKSCVDDVPIIPKDLLISCPMILHQKLLTVLNQTWKCNVIRRA